MSISNLNPSKEIKLEINLSGKGFAKINSGTILTAAAVNTVNTFEKPETIVPTALKMRRNLLTISWKSAFLENHLSFWSLNSDC